MAKSHKPTRTMSCTCRTDSVLHAFDCAYFQFAVNDSKTMLELFKYERATSNTFRDMVIEQMDEIRNLKAALDYQTQIPNKLNKYKKAIRQLKFDKEILEQKYDYMSQSHDNVSNNYKNKVKELEGVRCNLFISDHMNKDLEEKCNKLNKQATLYKQLYHYYEDDDEKIPRTIRAPEKNSASKTIKKRNVIKKK